MINCNFINYKKTGFRQVANYFFTIGLDAVACSPTPYDSGEAGLGNWLTGKLGRAQVGAWVRCMGAWRWCMVVWGVHKWCVVLPGVGVGEGERRIGDGWT